MKNYLVILLMAFALVSCGDATVKPDGDADDDASTSVNKDGAQVGAVDAGGRDAGQALAVSYHASAINDANSVLADRIVYFDFDSSKVSADYVEQVKHHGRYLSANSAVAIRLEGHSDERGTREYNIALADRRAQAVKRLLMFQGAADAQVTIISYGEEKPATLGHDDAAWSMNRRAELVYQ